MVMMKSHYTIKPITQTPNVVMYLSDCDLVSAITHAPTLYIYHKPSKEELSTNAVEVLKNSLSKALVLFYPLAGRLRYNDESGRLELDCNSDGARLFEAESQCELKEFGDFCPSPKLTAEVIPPLDRDELLHEQPVLLVQLTRFRCGGISIGLKISHTLADGQAALHFITEWARIARGEEPQNVPFLDRTILRVKEEDSLKPKFDHLEYTPPPLVIGHMDTMEERKKETTVSMFKLTKLQIEKLKEKANYQASLDNTNCVRRPFSRYEAVAGHVWRCASKARHLIDEQPIRLRMPVNFRNRVVPPLSPWYFGNAVLRMMACSTAGEISSNGLAYASSRIRSTVESFTDEYFKSSLVFLKGVEDLTQFQNFHTLGCTKAGFYGNPNCEITSWIGLSLMVADFGWGKAIHMGPGSLGFDGKCFILPAADEDGALNVVIRLQVANMGDFKKFFYDDI